MTLRSGHGNGAGVPRVEVLPVNELPRGVQAPAQDASTGERRPDGTWAKGARTAQRAGGTARAGATALARRLRLGDTFADPRFEPYARAARDFRRAQVTRLGRDVGGGQCGPGPASIVATASLQLAASRFFFEVLGDMTAGSRLGDASRQNLLAAHELCAREAQGRPKPRPAWELLLRPARPADALPPSDGPSSVEGVGDAATPEPERALAESGGPS